MSAVELESFTMTCLRYLPRPSWVMPRSTGTFMKGTSANCTVLLGGVKMACERSLPTLLRSMSKAATKLMSEM